MADAAVARVPALLIVLTLAGTIGVLSSFG
jgi:hypothetical protein